MAGICSSPDCPASAIKRGFCERHYRQARRKGHAGWDGTPCSADGCTEPIVARGLCDRHYSKALEVEHGPCVIEDCQSLQFARGWCKRHYARWRRHGDPLAWKKPVRQECSVTGCERKATSGGLCPMHRARVKRYGSTDLPAKPVHVDPPPFTCRQCGAELPKIKKGGRRVFCDSTCREAWQYWDRKNNSRAFQLKQYGLTIEQFDEMLARQNGRCAVCDTTEPGGRKNWCVDHCHVTGRVRGLLCMQCNAGLGNFRDDPKILEAAMRYLAADSEVRT